MKEKWRDRRDRSSRRCLTVDKVEGLVVPAPNSASSDKGSVSLYLRALLISVTYVGEWLVHFLDTSLRWNILPYALGRRLSELHS